MGRASVAALLASAMLLALPDAARALPSGYGRGAGYCAEFGSRASQYSFDGVYACATTGSLGPTPFDADGDDSFQCVELSARFLWAVYGIWAGPGTGVETGADLVAVVHSLYPHVRRGLPRPGNLPVAGDVISLGPGGAVDPRYGHTAIVTASNRRTGVFTIIGENFPPGRAGRQTVRVDRRGRHDGRVLLDGSWTRASWLKLRQPVRPAPPRRHGAASR